MKKPQKKLKQAKRTRNIKAWEREEEREEERLARQALREIIARNRKKCS
jgi:hypothetical protein